MSLPLDCGQLWLPCDVCLLSVWWEGELTRESSSGLLGTDRFGEFICLRCWVVWSPFFLFSSQAFFLFSLIIDHILPANQLQHFMMVPDTPPRHQAVCFGEFPQSDDESYVSRQNLWQKPTQTQKCWQRNSPGCVQLKGFSKPPLYPAPSSEKAPKEATCDCNLQWLVSKGWAGEGNAEGLRGGQRCAPVQVFRHSAIHPTKCIKGLINPGRDGRTRHRPESESKAGELSLERNMGRTRDGAPMRVTPTSKSQLDCTDSTPSLLHKKV